MVTFLPFMKNITYQAKTALSTFWAAFYSTSGHTSYDLEMIRVVLINIL